jgi:hypothetical protein
VTSCEETQDGIFRFPVLHVGSHTDTTNVQLGVLYKVRVQGLYFGIILCIRQCFIVVSVYTIRGTDIPYVFLYYMFRPDGAIFRYIRSHNHLFLFLLLSLHWPVFTHWECVYVWFYVMPCAAKRIKY